MVARFFMRRTTVPTGLPVQGAKPANRRVAPGPSAETAEDRRPEASRPGRQANTHRCDVAVPTRCPTRRSCKISEGKTRGREDGGDGAAAKTGCASEGDGTRWRRARTGTRPCSHSTESAFNPRGAFCRISFKHLAAGSFYRMGLSNGDKRRFRLQWALLRNITLI